MKLIAFQTLKSKKGITLIELLIVVAVVAILAGIAVPMYTNHMLRARRVEAKTALEQLRASEEMRRAERGSYISNLVELATSWGGPGATQGDYNITLAATSTTFTGTATPVTSRQSSDGWLAINQDGLKTSQYPDKWKK